MQNRQQTKQLSIDLTEESKTSACVIFEKLSLQLAINNQKGVPTTNKVEVEKAFCACAQNWVLNPNTKQGTNLYYTPPENLPAELAYRQLTTRKN